MSVAEWAFLRFEPKWVGWIDLRFEPNFRDLAGGENEPGVPENLLGGSEESRFEARRHGSPWRRYEECPNRQGGCTLERLGERAFP